MGIVLPKERFNTSCFYAGTKKCITKDYEIKTVNSNSEIANCRIGDCESENFLLKLRNQGISIVNKNINFDLNLN